MPIDDPPTDGGEQPPEGGNDGAPRPWRMRFPVQPAEDPGMEPIPGGPPYEHPEFGRGYPILRPVTEPRDAAEEEPPEIDPGFGQAERALLIDQLIGAIETGQISIDAVQALVKVDQANKFAVQNINAFAGAEEEVFAGDGLNQFTAIDTDPRAGPSALRPDPPKPNSPLQPDEASEEANSRIDLYKTAAGQKGTPPHLSPYGKKWNEPPDELPPIFPVVKVRNLPPFLPGGNEGTITSPYGWRTVNGKLDFHPGIDIRAGDGTPVKSAHGGTIKQIYKKGDLYGVVIKGDDGKIYTYFHINLEGLLPNGEKFEPGQRIEIGDPIGTVKDGPGGPHLHFSCHNPESGKWNDRYDETSCDPLA